MQPLETAAQLPPLQPIPNVLDAVRDGAERANDVVLQAVTHARAAMAERAYRVSEAWDTLPRWRRIGYRALAFTMSTAGAVTALQATRMVGAVAHGVDHAPVFHALPGHVDTPLPADLDQAPAARPLDNFQPHTGEGTVWNQVDEYADKMGYDPNGKQLHEVTGKILHDNHITWSDARHLSNDFKPIMPTQRDMEDYLETAGAHRTHTPDREVAVVPPAGGTDENNTAGTSSATPSPGISVSPTESVPPGNTPLTPFGAPAAPDGEWVPFFHDDWDWRDVAALGLVGAVGAAAFGTALRRPGPRNRTIVTPPVHGTSDHPDRDNDATPPHGIPVAQSPVTAQPASMRPPTALTDDEIRQRKLLMQSQAADAEALRAAARRNAGDDTVDKDKDGIDDRDEPGNRTGFLGWWDRARAESSGRWARVPILGRKGRVE